MRVLHIAHLLPYPPASGVALRTYHLARLLAKHAEVDFVALLRDHLVKGRRHDDVIERFQSETGVRVVGAHRVTEPSQLRKAILLLRSHLRGRPYETECLRHAPFAADVQRRVRDAAYDLLFVETVGLWPLVTGARAPLIVGHHNVESDLAQRRASRARFAMSTLLQVEAGFIRRVERHAARLGRLQVLPSRKDAELLRATTGLERLRTAVVPSGVDTAAFRPSALPPGAQRFDVLFLGSLGWHPNRDAVRRLAREVLPEMTKLRGRPVAAAVVGRTDGFERDVQNWATPELRFTGFVDDPVPYLQDAKLLVAPLSYGGGTKLKVLCAMACGVPVVTTPDGAEGLDVGPDTGVAVCDGSEGIARAACDLLADEGRRERWARAARTAAVERYEWDVIGRAVGECLQDALETSDENRHA